MSPALMPMMFTVAAAIGVFYLCSDILNLPDVISMIAGLLTAIISSALLAGWKRKKKS